MSDAAVTPPEAALAQAESALVDDIKRHGENAYYYAHRRNIGPTSIRAYDEPPRLLSSTAGASAPTTGAAPLAVVTLPPAAAARQVPIQTYAWADSGATVKVYVEQLPGLDSLADDGAVALVQPDATTVELRVSLPDATHVLRLAPLYAPIAGATTKRSAKRVVVTLRKAEEGQTFTWYTLLGTKKAAAASGAAASPLSTAGGDFDFSSMLGSTTAGLEGADEDF